MRRAVAALALTLLSSASAVAQVRVRDEVVSAPLQDHVALFLYSEPMPVPAVSLAKDRAGMAMAWTMGNAQRQERVYVARLDGAGRMAGEVREIPLANPASAHQVYPSLAVAPGGSGFVLAWMEIDAQTPVWRRVVFARLDASLKASAATLLYPASILTPAPPVVRTKGDTTWIAGGGALASLASLAENGTLSATTGVAPTDMTLAMGTPLLVAGGQVRTGTSCACLGLSLICGCPVPVYRYSLGFTALQATSQTTSFSLSNEMSPAIESNGNDALVVWSRGPASGGDIVALRLSPAEFSRFSELAGAPRTLGFYPSDFGPNRPSVATDGQRYVVVWRVRSGPGNHDIAGVVIDADGKLTPLSIASSSADELDPAILYLGGGTFLVAYEKTAHFERRIASRFITVPAGRRRPTR